MNNEEKKGIPPELEEGENMNSRNADNAAANAGDGPDWKAEAEKYRDLCLRTQADMENMKKRLEREKTEFFKFANENLIKDLLPVLDNMDRALNHAQNECAPGEGLVEGVRMTYTGILAVLEKYGVQQMCAAGAPFDPNFHEAVMQQESADAEPNTVLAEVQKGYLLNDRLIRPAMVIVSKKPNNG